MPFCTYYLRGTSRRSSVLWGRRLLEGVALGCFGKDVLATFGYLSEYPTCSKAVGWYGIRCCVYLAWPIEPSVQNSSAPRDVLRFLDYLDLVRRKGAPFLPGRRVEWKPVVPRGMP